MRLLTILSAALLSLLLSGPVAAGGCAFCVESVTVQTRDGGPWSSGQPIVLVVSARSNSGAALPESALAVVMQTDGEKTKCLDVALRKVAGDDAAATYAGVFFPFREATYDGRVSIGDDVTDIKFVVGSGVPAQAPTAIGPGVELPVAAPVSFDDYPLALGTILERAPQIAVGLGILAAIALAALRIRPRIRVAPAA